MLWIVPVAALPQQHLLAPLRGHAEGCGRHTVAQFGRRRDAAQPQPIERLDHPVLGDGTRDAFDELGTVVVCPARLAFGLLMSRQRYCPPRVAESSNGSGKSSCSSDCIS